MPFGARHPYDVRILLLVLVFALCVRIVFFTGITNIDSLAYAENAHSIVQGTFEVSDYVHKLRLGLILPTAVVYRLFGVSELTSALYPFLCSLGSVVLIFSLGQLLFKDSASSLMCAALLAIFPMDVFFASQVMTEGPLSFLMALAVYCFLKGESLTDHRKRAKWYYILSGVMAGMAFMTKSFAALLLLFFLVYILYRRQLSTVSAYLWIALGGCGVLILEMGFYYLQTGDPLFRFFTILSSPGRGYDPNPGKMYLNFLFLYPYYWFVSLQHFGFFYYFIISAFLYSLWNKVRKTYIPMLWAVSLFLYLQFGREGKYLIHKEARFLSILTIPCLLVLGYSLTKLYKQRKKMIFRVLVTFLALTSLFFIFFQQTLERTEFENLRETARYLRQVPDDKTIFTDHISRIHLEYLLGYRDLQRLKPFNLFNTRTGENSYPVDLLQLEQAFIVVNWHEINTLKHKGITAVTFPESIYDPPPSWEVVHSIQATDNWVYGLIRMLQQSPFLEYLPRRVARKMKRTVDRVLKSHAEMTIIYQISQE